jgi:hypothetical protein
MHGCHHGGITGVTTNHNATSMSPFTVHGPVHPIIGNGCRGGDPRGSLPWQRAFCVPRTRRTYAKGVGRSRAFVLEVGQSGDRARRDAWVRHFDDVMGARARRKLPPRGWPRLGPYDRTRATRELVLSLRQLNRCHAISALGWVCLISIPGSSPLSL